MAQGGTYISPVISARLRPDTPVENAGGLNRLSRREREIFRLVVAGRGSKEIASKLFISIKTVDTHRTNINRKLGVRTTASLIRFAAAHGIEIAPVGLPGRGSDITPLMPAASLDVHPDNLDWLSFSSLWHGAAVRRPPGTPAVEGDTRAHSSAGRAADF